MSDAEKVGEVASARKKLTVVVPGSCIEGRANRYSQYVKKVVRMRRLGMRISQYQQTIDMTEKVCGELLTEA